ncbi:MAG: uracil-DNA glycosylase family protein [Erysipelotrichaceae bacterium]|nr:uracil-DNA glycosylase family protein [Erysipelotrichaceae bacterium]
MNRCEQLHLEILNCKECKERFGFIPIPIVHGNMNAKIMQISQAPSLMVEKTKKPFNDLSGKKLKYEWYQISDEIFYDPNYFYITSLGHCYPGKSKNGGDRLPPISCAKKWLVQEIECIENEIYIIIGSKAAKFFFKDQSFETLVFNDQVLNGKLTYVLPHPSPLNIRWFKQYPQFEQRISTIRQTIHKVLER